MRYAIIAWLLGGQLWLAADPMSHERCMAIVLEVAAQGIVYVAEDLPQIERLGCFPIEDA